MNTSIMKSMSYLGAFLFTLGIMISCADGTSHDTTGSNSGNSALKVSEGFGGFTFEIEAPFSTAILEVSPDGVCSYEASSPKTGIEKQTATKAFTEDEVALLVEAAKDAEFFSLKELYQPELPIEDISVYSISITIDGETKKVSCRDYDECPEGFKKVMETIKTIWGDDILQVGV